MVRVRVDESQSRVIRDGERRIELVDEQGCSLGFADITWTAEDLRQAKAAAASDGPRYTTAEVLQMLASKTLPE